MVSDRRSSPAIDVSGDVIWGSADQHLRRSTTNGDPIWDVVLDGPITTAPAIGADGTLFTGAGASLLAIDGSSGAVKWRVGIGANVTAAPAIGADGSVYTGAENGILQANAADGTTKWQVQTGGAVRSSPAIGGDGTIYFGSGDAIVYSVDASGQRLGTFRALDSVQAGIAIGPNGLVYAGSRDNRLYALRENARRFSESPPDRLGGDLVRDPLTGRVFVIADGQRRYIPDPTTQLLLGLAGPAPLVLTGPEMTRYPEGPALPTLANGAIVQASNGPIYVIVDGKRMWIRSLADFASGGYRWEQVTSVEDRMGRSIPLRPEEGLLVKGGGDRVFLVSGGRKQWISTAEAFVARGYDWSQVHFVTEATLQLLPEGTPIS